MKHQLIGEHIFATLKLCNPIKLNDLEYIEDSLVKSCIAAKCKVLDVVSHQFFPRGVTSVLLLEESHISIHTYPEYSSAFVDIFTCGITAKPEEALISLVDSFNCNYVNQKKICRN